VIANGFSCREQVAQGTDRQALHLAEVLQLAQHSGPSGLVGSYPERAIVGQREAAILESMKRSAWTVAGVVAGVALLRQISRSH
jgi:hypothetical protein